MNYFELYNIPVTFLPDKQLVNQKYFELQKKYHPDFFANASTDEKEEALELSAMANKAYKVFRSLDETIKYVLQLKGLLQEEEKYTLPPGFLMEMLELNEMKMDGIDEKEMIRRTETLLSDLSTDIQPIIKSYEDGVTPDTELLKIKQYYYKLKYLHRIMADS